MRELVKVVKRGMHENNLGNGWGTKYITVIEEGKRNIRREENYKEKSVLCKGETAKMD